MKTTEEFNRYRSIRFDDGTVIAPRLLPDVKRKTLPTGPAPLSLRICGWIIVGAICAIGALVVICAQLYWTEITR